MRTESPLEILSNNTRENGQPRPKMRREQILQLMASGVTIFFPETHHWRDVEVGADFIVGGVLCSCSRRTRRRLPYSLVFRN